jgi:uncharacterized protein (TIGR03643 family)
MQNENENFCYYSGLPSPMAYLEVDDIKTVKQPVLTDIDLNRIIEMAWEDRTPFDAIRLQFGLNESAVKVLMKKNLKFSSYKLWRERVESCRTKHAAKRVMGINRFKCNLQRTITQNKVSKR